MTRGYSKNRVFFAACLGILLFGIVFLSLGSVNNMLAERFGLDDNAIGTLTALLPLGILIGSFVFGPVVDRFGYRWMLIMASLLVGGALEGIALVQRADLIKLYVFFIGLGGGILNGATNALAADVSEGERGAKLSLLGVFFGIGALSMPGLLALLSRHFPLHQIVSAVGAVTLAPAVYCLLIRFPPPKQRDVNASSARILALLADPIFLFAGLAMAIQSGMEGMSNDWMTRYFKKVTLAQESHVAEWHIQLGLVAVTGALVIARLFLSIILKRISSRIVLFSSIAVSACGALLLMSAPSYAVSLVAALLIGAGLAAGFPVVLGYIGDRYPQQSGTAFSTIFVLALLGNMAINKSFGYIAQIHGIGQYARVMLGCLAGSALLLFLMIRQLAKNPHDQTYEQPGFSVAPERDGGDEPHP